MKALYLCIFISVVLFSSCKKSSDDDNGGSNTPKIPTLTTTAASAITSTSLQSGGTITSDGGSAITARGVCWRDISTGPTIADNKTTDGSGAGSFTSKVTGLTPYNAYYVRAYATNAVGTAYGNEIVVLTSPGVTIATAEVYVNNYHRICETQITINGFSDPSSLPVTESGVCWGKAQNPTIADSKVANGPVTVIYSHFLSTLALGINSAYYIRGYAKTSAGVTYGNQVTYVTGVDIGLYHGGGIIYYVDNTGQHGLIAATSDQGAAIPWAPGNLYATLTNATSTTDGAANTTKIISTYGNSGTYAAKLCRDYRGGNFTDWYLPSGEETFLMQNKQDAIGGFHGSAFLTNFYYWSSTENNYFRAWEYDFNPRYLTVSAAEKRILLYVRAVRAF